MSDIRPISFSEIHLIWEKDLWPDRLSTIDSISAIDSSGNIDMAIMKQTPFFWGFFSGSKLHGVVSGFQTSAQEFRVRGIWVHNSFRHQGVGRDLVQEAQKKALNLGCCYLWTMPRMVSWGFYQKCGFEITGETDRFEFGPHYLAKKDLRDCHEAE